MNHPGLQRLLPRFLRRYVLHFEALIEDSLGSFSRNLPEAARVLDAGAGETGHRVYFTGHRYVALDLAVGDAAWDYGRLDVLGDLTAIPFAAGAFEACINIVTLEHLREPASALRELHRVLKPGGRLLLIVPHEWEVHQSPHDYFRYTRHGVEYLLTQAGFAEYTIQPAGGYFRLLSRRLLNGLQFFPGPSVLIGAVLFAPAALVLPWLDGLDRKRDFTLGYICTARKHG